MKSNTLCTKMVESMKILLCGRREDYATIWSEEMKSYDFFRYFAETIANPSSPHLIQLAIYSPPPFLLHLFLLEDDDFDYDDTTT